MTEHVVARAGVVVIGLGSVGSMALWRLAGANDGCSVLGIEQFGQVHGNGAYPGESRLFRVAAKEGALYTPALLRSRQLWTELEAESGRELLVKAGALSIAPEGFPDLEQTLKSISDYQLPHRVLDAAELRRSYPQFHIEDDDTGVLDSLGGAMRPEAAVATATQQALALGAQAWFDTEVLDLEDTGDGVLVHTTRGVVQADRVIVTTGPWSTRLLPALRRKVKVGNFTLTWFLPRHPEMFTPDKLPGFMRDLNGEHVFGVPTLDGASIKVSAHLDLPEVGDYAERFTTVSPEALERATRVAHMMIPDLVGGPVRWSAHPDAVTESHVPIIDTMADGRIVIGTGFSGNGFKFAPVWGEVMAELALTGEAEFADEVFTISAH